MPVYTFPTPSPDPFCRLSRRSHFSPIAPCFSSPWSLLFLTQSEAVSHEPPFERPENLFLRSRSSNTEWSIYYWPVVVRVASANSIWKFYDRDFYPVHNAAWLDRSLFFADKRMGLLAISAVFPPMQTPRTIQRSLFVAVLLLVTLNRSHFLERIQCFTFFTSEVFFLTAVPASLSPLRD